MLEQTAPTPTDYETGTFDYSGSGDVTAPVQAVDVEFPPAGAAGTTDSGCEASDFAGFTPGNIALIQRGACTFEVKANNAKAAGASAVIIFNEGQPGRHGAVHRHARQPGRPSRSSASATPTRWRSTSSSRPAR